MRYLTGLLRYRPSLVILTGMLWAASVVAAPFEVTSVDFSSRARVEAFAPDHIAELKKHGVSVVRIDHTGPMIPSSLGYYVKYLIRNKIKVDFHWLSREKFELAEQLDAIILQDLADVDAWVASVGYGESKPEGSSLSVWTEMKAAVRDVLGIPGGLTFEAYNPDHSVQKRSLKDKALDAGITAGKLGVSIWAMHYAAQRMVSEGKWINEGPAPYLLLTAFTIFFEYFWQRHSEFRSQGVAFDFENNRPVANRAVYFLKGLMDSLVMRQSTSALAHWNFDLGVVDGFGMTATDAARASEASVKGMFSKAYVEGLIDKNRSRLIFGVWAMACAAPQMLDQMGVGNEARLTMLALGVGGLVIDAARKRHVHAMSLKNTILRIRHRHEAHLCSTRLTALPQIPEPELEIARAPGIEEAPPILPSNDL